MSKKIIINIVLFLSCSFAQTVQISAYPDTVGLVLVPSSSEWIQGTVIILTVKVVGSESFAELDISPIKKDFMVISGPRQQTSYQFVNGQAISSKSLIWTLVPKKNGTLMIPSLSGKIDGKPFTGEPIEILVDNSYQVLVEDSVFFITTELDKDEAFVGEQVTVTYKLYTRVQMSLEDIKYPESVGFWSEELSVPRPLRFNQTTINGVQYNVATLYKVALFPTKTGALELSPMTARCNVQVKTKRRQREIFDDPFFINFFNETVQKVFRTEPRTIRVKPYPVGQPANFTGAVGSFEISSYIDREFCKENEVFTFTIAMNGTGNGGMFNLPDVKFPEGIEVYPFKQNFEKDSLQSQLQFNQSWDYYLIPRRKGKLKILPVQMSYFDLESSSWKRTQTNPIELSILPADNSSVSREKRSGSSIKHKIKTRSYPLNDIIIALDISSSMLANDISPNRFEASKNTISNFLTGDINARIGLLAFAGESFIECPITYNHYVLRRIIENIDIAKKETDGTAIGIAICNAIYQVKSSKANTKSVILITDGSSNAGEIDPRTAAELAATYNIKIYTIGTGTNQEASFIDGRGFIKNEIDEETLSYIAEKTGGRYFRAKDLQALESIFSEIDTLYLRN